jgi:hypothetical protein
MLAIQRTSMHSLSPPLGPTYFNSPNIHSIHKPILVSVPSSRTQRDVDTCIHVYMLREKNSTIDNSAPVVSKTIYRVRLLIDR